MQDNGKSKTTLCIEMLQILNSGRTYKVSELAYLLDTKERNVIEYKRELEEAGYYIKSIPGKYGGYRLDKTNLFPSIILSEEEKKAFSEATSYITARNDFLYKNQFQKAVSKINSSVRQNTIEEETAIYYRYPLVMSKEKLEKRYSLLKACIPARKEQKGVVVEMEYLSLKNEISVRKFHPYKIYMYNNAWFVLGYDEKSDSFRYFKLNRIQNIKITNEKFRIRLSYNESEYLDEFGMKQNGEYYPIKLKLTGNYAVLAQERIYGRNQSILVLEDGSAILSCEMQNEEDILNFVLGFGENCEVLEPEWIKERLFKALGKLYQKYEKEKK